MALTGSQKYWANREAEALKHNIKDEKQYDKELKQIYSDMLDSIQNEINAFYGRYASKEGITLAEAKKRVSKLDIEMYERKAKRYVREKDFSPQANEEMRLYNLTMKVNRLEMLKANISLELISGHQELENFMADILKGRTEDELERQAGVLGKTIKNNAQKANAIVNASFHNATFSDRIWQYQDMLKAEVSKLLQSGLIAGKNPRVLARGLKKQFDVSTYNAERLMRTELARVQTDAQKQSFERNGFDMYTFICNKNPSKQGTCDICKGLNGKHFKVEDMMPGKNAPPVHPNCRCSTAAYEDSDDYENWLDFLDKGGTTEEWEKLKTAKDKPQFKEIKNAIDFQYGNYTDEDYNKWWDKYDEHNKGVSLSAEELKAIEDYTEGGYIGLNDINRYSEAEMLKKGYSAEDITRLRKKSDLLSGALTKYDLDTDIVTHRFERNVSWLTGKGNDVADLKALIGSEYTQKGFTSSGVLSNRFRFTGGKSDAVHFEIVTPKGTDGAFLSMSKKGENEFLYNKNTKFRVLDGGERIVKERKYNFKTGAFDEVDIKERFLKVQVMTDKAATIQQMATNQQKPSSVLTKSVKSGKIQSVKFNKATTIQEAEEYVKQFVNDKHWAGIGVSYSGISVESANAVNEALTKLYDRFDMDKLGGVYVAKGNTKLGKTISGASAAYSPIRKSLLLNNKSFKNIKHIIEAHAEELRLIEMYTNDPKSLVFKSKKAETTMKASLVSGRATVPDTLEDVINHEMGHALEGAVFKAKNYNTIKSNMSKFADKISGYATINEGEYIAESFASYLKGEKRIDPELEKAFKRLEKSKSISFEKSSGGTSRLEKIGNTGVHFSSKQIGHKIGRHAKDFKLNPGNSEHRKIIINKINTIIKDSEEIRKGDWRGQTEPVDFYIKGSDVVVVTSNSHEFITILKGGVNNERVKNARKR